jgi:exoribonuclease-2
MIVEMVIGLDGSLLNSDVYQAAVRNHAKLAYNSVGAWLEGKTPAPEAVAAIEGLAENLLLQDRAARKMKCLRHAQGALSLETIEANRYLKATKSAT